MAAAIWRCRSGAHGAVLASHSGVIVMAMPRRRAMASHSARIAATAARRLSSVGARTSSEKRTLPGMTFIAPGSASMRPTVPTTSGIDAAMRSTASTHSAAAASASRRRPIGTVPGVSGHAGQSRC